MALLDLLGAASTLCLSLLGLVGYLAALLALRERSVGDPLSLAIAALTASTAAGVGVALLLGALGLLRIEVALALLAAAALLLVRAARARAFAGPALRQPAAGLVAACRRRLQAHPALALALFHAAASEALRGLLRPPLSWDSLITTC